MSKQVDQTYGKDTIQLKRKLKLDYNSTIKRPYCVTVFEIRSMQGNLSINTNYV